MSLLPSFLLILASYAATLGLTVIVRRMLIKRALFDHPNERSSHTTPTPRGGGQAVMTIVIPSIFVASLFTHTFPAIIPLLTGAIVVVVVSWADDVRGINPVLRLTSHIVAAFVGSLALPTDAEILNGVLPFWLDRTVMVIGWAWFMNLYNFMDGIDGITSIETVAIATGVCLLMTVIGMSDPFIEIMTLVLTGAGLGFLALNWHPAKIFLGDVGSVALGFLIGYVLLVLAVNGHIVPALILPLYYLADSGITITQRALRRETIWQAHRQHFYQRAAAALGRHDVVALRICATNIALICAAIISVEHPLIGSGLAVFLVAILLWWMQKTAKMV